MPVPWRSNSGFTDMALMLPLYKGLYSAKGAQPQLPALAVLLIIIAVNKLLFNIFIFY
jgi:hypothetical protein